jgi:hypothetical protein
MIVCGVFAALFESGWGRRGMAATDFRGRAYYDSRKGLTLVSGWNM